MARDRSIDTIRGALIIIISINHINSVLSKLTTGTLGYVTAMEGFVFISGLVSGLVYTKKYHQESFGRFCTLTSKRALTIYKYHMASVLLLLICLVVWPDHLANVGWPWVPLAEQPFFSSIFRYGTLVNVSAHLQILPIYCILIFLLPVFVTLAEKSGATVLILLSLTLWFIAQAGVRFDIGSYNLLAWQFIFISGFSVGFLRYSSQSRGAPTALISSNLLLIVAICLFIPLFSLRLFEYGAVKAALGNSFLLDLKVHAENMGLSVLTEKTNVAPLRLLNFILVAYLIARVVKRYKSVFSIKTLEFFGRHSLQIFTFQALVVFFFQAIGLNLATVSTVVNLAVTLAVIAAIYALCLGYQRYKALLKKNKSVALPETHSSG